MGIMTTMLAGSFGLASCDEGVDQNAEAHRLVEQEGATLLDVRTREEYGRGHIDGALNIPVQELAGRRGEVPADAPVVVYCHSGGRSAAAARELEAAGYQVFDLGGMSAWRR